MMIDLLFIPTYKQPQFLSLQLFIYLRPLKPNFIRMENGIITISVTVYILHKNLLLRTNILKKTHFKTSLSDYNKVKSTLILH